MIADTGTTMILGPSNETEKINSMIFSAAMRFQNKTTQNQTQNTRFFPCDQAIIDALPGY